MPIPATPKPATLDDAPLVSAALARAFDDDPMLRRSFPDDASREESLVRYFTTLFMGQHLHHGVCERTDGAAAFWVAAGAQAVPGADSVQQLQDLLGVRAPLFRDAVETAARHTPRGPHWPLAVIGADPAARGQGHGAALLRSGLARADAAGLPVYLESCKSANIPFCEHFGFTVREEVPLPGDGPTRWGMWREPRHAS
ncbi:GNAT family N-acetyltransferase [Streptomyces sp. NPDC053367]|uniref:GNAT family N-acetyltransferase n=1 Tax=Streptomyces sp. NPDC053367 TaxID=3365700 RepID=UPI0037D11B08